MKWVVASVLCGLIGSSIAIASQPTKGDQPVEDVVTLSSIQFATHFELMKKCSRASGMKKCISIFVLRWARLRSNKKEREHLSGRYCVGAILKKAS